jgi:hypothetical protein
MDGDARKQKESPTPLARGAIKVALKPWVQRWMDGCALGQPFSRLSLSCVCHAKLASIVSFGFYRVLIYCFLCNLLISRFVLTFRLNTYIETGRGHSPVETPKGKVGQSFR